jgi:hypothetical protein
LRTGLAFQGNRLLRSEELALEQRTQRPVRSSRLTALVLLPWTVLFSRLRAVAEPGES